MKKQIRQLIAALVFVLSITSTVQAEHLKFLTYPFTKANFVIYNGWHYKTGASFHGGIDYNLNYEMVVAAADGIVEYTLDDQPNTYPGTVCYGNYVKINHGNGYWTIYGHLKSKLIMVQKNQRVSRGQPIATSGNTGYSSAPHLHFEVWGPSSGGVLRNGAYKYDPYGLYYTDGKVDPYTSNIMDETKRLWSTSPPSHSLYAFSSHAYTGIGDVQGGAGTDWNYSLPTRKTQFTVGETAKAIIRVENITVRHRWFVEIWSQGVKLREYSWGWGEVGPWGWKTSYFWPEQTVNSEGEYQFRVYLYIGDDSRRDHIIDLPFTVVKPAGWKPYDTYDNNGYTGYGPEQGGENTNWKYSLPQKIVTFNQGDHIYGLVYVKNVSVDHRWLVRFYKDGTYFDIQLWGKATVGQWTWQYSHFWPELWNASVGNWEMRVFLENGGKEDYICTLPFTVVRPANWQPYTYDNNGYTGYGPQQGGADTGWNYSLPRRAAVFNQGDHVYGMIRLDNISVNHRFHLAAYRDNALAYEYVWVWNDVGGYRWNTVYFWPELGCAEPGNWEFEVYLEHDGQIDFIDSLYFTVNGQNNPPPPVKPSIRFDFNGHNANGWTVGYNTAYAAQDQLDVDTWMVAAQGPNPGVISPELPSGFSASQTPQLRFSVKARGSVRQTYGQVWLMDNNGYWGYETRFAPVKVDYLYHEYAIDLSRFGNIPIRRFSIELTQDAPYEQWIFDWVELK